VTAARAEGIWAMNPVDNDRTRHAAMKIDRTFLMNLSSLGCAASIEDDGDGRGRQPAQTRMTGTCRRPSNVAGYERSTADAGKLKRDGLPSMKKLFAVMA